MLKNNRILLLLGCMAILLSGCTAAGGNKLQERKEALLKNEKLWNLHSPDDYQFTFNRQCFCAARPPFPALIIVKSDTIHTVLEPSTKDTLYFKNDTLPAYQKYPRAYKTVPELYPIIEDAIERNVEVLKTDYDQDYGYPKKINIVGSKDIADDGVIYSVDSLRFSSE